MNFVGRKREIAAVIRSLKQKRNVVLTGSYGVGRSSLIKHISGIYSETWQFLCADFSKTVARSCNEMINQLASAGPRIQAHSYTRLMYAKDILMGRKEAAELPRVIVLDNIGKISRPKLAFIRDMRLESDLLFIAITESFLPEVDLFRLGATLYPSDLLTLHNLKRKEIIAFFRNFSQRKRLGWSESLIQRLAASTGGYSLLMQNIAQRETEFAPNGKKIPKTVKN
jgi:energy-coupling factor transporter ATP-binding protein EcfA2